MACDDVVVENNIITGNKSVGMIFTDFSLASSTANDPDNSRMIGPPTQIIQALYMDNPQGIVDYITSPTKKRDDYPEMPPQNYLSEEVRMAAAEYMLQVKN